jgi:hypothetical protein
VSSRCLMTTSIDCPPAIILAPSLYWESRERASLTVLGAKYSKVAIIWPPQLELDEILQMKLSKIVQSSQLLVKLYCDVVRQQLIERT